MNDSSKRKTDILRREALGWVQHLTAGKVTRVDAAAFRHWLRQSAAHEDAFEEASALWKNIGIAGQNLRSNGTAPPELMAAPSTIGRRALLTGALATAATAGAYAVVRPPFALWPSWADLMADYRTTTGEQRSLTLANVAIRLNTQSSISLGASGKDADKLRLISGEASFSTSAASTRTLIVLAGQGQAIARQARFDVRHEEADAGSSVRVICLDGGVRVEHRDGALTLGPSQQLTYSASRLGSITAADVSLETAWQQGILVFRLTPLSQVVDEINRYRPGRVILLNEALGQSPVSGRFRIDHMDKIFARIEAAFNAKIRFFPGGLVLLS